jgi:hypothetical protein
LSTKVTSPGNIELEVVGPAGTLYGYRDSAGKVAQCRQIARGTVATPLPGLPATSNQTFEVVCEKAGKPASGGKVLVKVKFESFSYDFEVPASTEK